MIQRAECSFSSVLCIDCVGEGLGRWNKKKKSYMITEHNITANRRDGKKEKRAGKGLSKQSLTLQ